MIIETKYRDIPFEETLKCMAATYRCDGPLRDRSRVRWEERLRGKPLHVKTPGRTQDKRFCCDGPFYVDSEATITVCPHIAEIGD